MESDEKLKGVEDRLDGLRLITTIPDMNGLRIYRDSNNCMLCGVDVPTTLTSATGTEEIVWKIANPSA